MYRCEPIASIAEVQRSVGTTSVTSTLLSCAQMPIRDNKVVSRCRSRTAIRSVVTDHKTHGLLPLCHRYVTLGRKTVGRNQ